MASFIGSTLRSVNANTSDFSPDELDISKTETSRDLIQLTIDFITGHWDDIVIVVIVLCIVFLFVLVTGIELKLSENVEKHVRKIVFNGKQSNDDTASTNTTSSVTKSNDSNTDDSSENG